MPNRFNTVDDPSPFANNGDSWLDPTSGVEKVFTGGHFAPAHTGATGTLPLTSKVGHLAIPLIAGSATTAPTLPVGHAGLAYDPATHRLWVYDGAWKSVALA